MVYYKTKDGKEGGICAFGTIKIKADMGVSDKFPWMKDHRWDDKPEDTSKAFRIR
jgi:hypothetical protein